MANDAGYEQPRWLRDLLRFLPLKSQFVLSGNVRDFQLTEVSPGTVAAQPLTAVLATELTRAGYSHSRSLRVVTELPTDRAVALLGIVSADGPDEVDT